MIIGVSIKNFKAIRELNKLPLDRFHVLVGPNASGKTTFLDAFEFVRDCLEIGPLGAVESRVPEFRPLQVCDNGKTARVSKQSPIAARMVSPFLTCETFFGNYSSQQKHF